MMEDIREAREDLQEGKNGEFYSLGR